ncbi:hypothetical protein [Bacillus anthracis]
MKKVKSVAFNVADPMEYEMFHYAADSTVFQYIYQEINPTRYGRR